MVPKRTRITSILVPEDGRKVQEDVVQELVRSIDEIGLLQPIVVNTKLELVAGQHRLEAFKRLGRKTIPAVKIEVTTLKQELSRIDENLVRAKLSPLEEAEALAKRKVIYETMYPGSVGGNHQAACIEQQRKRFGPGYIPPKMKHPPKETFNKNTARTMGIDESSVAYRVRRATNIAPDVKEEIRKNPKLDRAKNLDTLAKMQPKEQRKVIERVKRGEIKTPSNVARNNCRRCEKSNAITLWVPVNERSGWGKTELCVACLGEAVRYMLDRSDEALELFERWSVSTARER